MVSKFAFIFAGSMNQAFKGFLLDTKIMKDYYTSLFDWLNKCEHIFGFDLDGYSKIRIYAFLAERFLPYWFNEYTKVKEWPILFYDLNEKN